MPKKAKSKVGRIVAIVVILLIVIWGIWYAVSQRGKKAQVEVWGTSAQPTTAQLEASLLSLKEKLGGKLTVDIHLISSKDAKGEFQSYAQAQQSTTTTTDISKLDIEENKRQLVIQKYWPQNFTNYLEIRNQGQNIYDQNWEKYALYAGLDKTKVSEKTEKEGDELLNKEIEAFAKIQTQFKEKYGQALTMVPIVLINGQFYEGAGETMSLAAAILKPILRGKSASLAESSKVELFKGLITFSRPGGYSVAGLTECYAPLDCNDNPAKIGECTEVGTLKAHCVYTEPAQVDLTILTSKDCISCASDLIVSQLKRDFKGLKSQEIDINSTEGKTISQNLNVAALPAFIFESNVQKGEAFQYYSQSQILIPIGQAGQYTISQIPTQMFLGREKKANTMELWVMSLCPYGAPAENKMISQLKKKPGSFTLDIRFIVSLDEEGQITSLHGDKEIEENKRQLVIQKYYSDKFFDYLLKRNENLEGNWEEAAKATGIDVASVNAKMSEADLMLKEEASLAQELNISASPTYFWENQQMVNGTDLTKISVFSDLEESGQVQGACQ